MIAILKNMVYSSNIEINLEDMEMRDYVQAAKLMRMELKVLFPSVKFSVTYSSYSMGDSVSVDYINGPTYDDVCEITNKYQYGGRDSIRVENLPQTMFVHVRRTASKEISK